MVRSQVRRTCIRYGDGNVDFADAAALNGFVLKIISTTLVVCIINPPTFSRWWLSNLQIDLGQMGVGGDDSRGAHTHDKYKLFAKSYSFKFLMEPVVPSRMNHH